MAASSDLRTSRHRQTERKESCAWERVYGEDKEIRRRQRAIPGKLCRLGIHEAPRDAAILDMCCGHGEALNALHDMGFRCLSGLDASISETLAADGRFALRIGDARSPDYPNASFDWILNIHALHHLRTAEGIERFLGECSRILRPGGRLGIIDFPASPQIRAAFWCLRQDALLQTRYLRNLGRIVQEEWNFLKDYLPQWPRVRRLLYSGPFEVEAVRHGLFYFHLKLRKPAAR